MTTTMTSISTRYQEASREELVHLVSLMQRQISFLGHCKHFGCATRQAVELAFQDLDLRGYAVIFFDIDNLKAFNDLLGQPEANHRIGSVLQTRIGDLIAGQWYSGDEFVVLAPEKDAYGLAQRLLTGLRGIGSSATFCIASWQPDVPTIQQVDQLTELCGLAKQRGERGVIFDLRDSAAWRAHTESETR